MKKASLFSILSALYLFAATPAMADDNSAATLQMKASKRLYPGGRDEEDLKVLSQVPEPALKVDRQTVQGSVMKSMSGQPESNQNSEAQD